MNREQFWFLNTLVTVRLGVNDSQDGISVLEHRAPFGDSPPLHIHHTEDEIFHILEGEFLFEVSGQRQHHGPGAIVLAPKGAPHSYRVESRDGGRWLTVTAHGDFEQFVRAASRPAEKPELPPASAPTPEAVATLAKRAGAYGIELVGLPLS